MQVHGDSVRIGVHSGQQYATFDECLTLWQRAEALGYDWVSIFDHVRPGAGGHEGPCFEGTSLLAALAARTERIRCAVLVLAVPYRHPALVAAAAATIDHVSGGRLELGLGAGGGDLGNGQYGLPFPGLRQRMQMLDEACRVIRGLLEAEVTNLDGRYFQLKDARLRPKPLQRCVPLVIGGSDERLLLPIAARHADVWNTFASDLETYRHKVDVLAAHCREIGRDPRDVRKSLAFRALLAPTEREAEEKLVRVSGGALEARSQWLAGTPEQCAEALMTYRDLGVRDFLLAVRPPLDWESIELFPEVGKALQG